MIKRARVIIVGLICAVALMSSGCSVVDKGMSTISELNLSKLYYQLEYGQSIAEAASAYGVNPYLIAAVIKCESNFDPRAISSAASKGLMQVSDEAASDMAAFGYVDEDLYDPGNLFDPTTNIHYGTAYLSYLLVRYGGDEEAAITAYNAGPSNVDRWMKWGGKLSDAIDFAETKAYLVSVMAAKDAYEKGYPHAFE